MSELTANPAVPAHASDAVADPTAVQGELASRAAAARAAAPAPRGIGTDAALESRARALRARAEALRQTNPGADEGAAETDCDPTTANCPTR